jgi:hypothetical protein
MEKTFKVFYQDGAIHCNEPAYFSFMAKCKDLEKKRVLK